MLLGTPCNVLVLPLPYYKLKVKLKKLRLNIYHHNKQVRMDKLLLLIVIIQLTRTEPSVNTPTVHVLDLGVIKVHYPWLVVNAVEHHTCYHNYPNLNLLKQYTQP